MFFKWCRKYSLQTQNTLSSCDVFKKSCSSVYQAIRQTAHAAVSKSVVRAQNESRCFRAFLLPPGQCQPRCCSSGARPGPGRAVLPAEPLPVCPGWLCKSCGRGEKFGEQPGACEELINGGACDLQVLAGLQGLGDTGAHSGDSSDSAVFFFFKPGLWLKMPRFQLTLPFKWLCKALSRFPAHIRSRAGSVSLQNKHTGCKSCDSEDRLQYSSPLLP